MVLNALTIIYILKEETIIFKKDFFRTAKNLGTTVFY